MQKYDKNYYSETKTIIVNKNYFFVSPNKGHRFI